MKAQSACEPKPLKAMPAQDRPKRVLSNAYKDVTSRAYKQTEAQALQHANKTMQTCKHISKYH